MPIVNTTSVSVYRKLNDHTFGRSRAAVHPGDQGKQTGQQDLASKNAATPRRLRAPQDDKTAAATLLPPAHSPVLEQALIQRFDQQAHTAHRPNGMKAQEHLPGLQIAPQKEPVSIRVVHGYANTSDPRVNIYL